METVTTVAVSILRKDHMDLFHIIDDAFAVLRSKGVYRQAKLYWRGPQLYAAWGGGFIRILKHGGTSNPNVSCVELPAELAP